MSHVLRFQIKLWRILFDHFKQTELSTTTNYSKFMKSRLAVSAMMGRLNAAAVLTCTYMAYVVLSLFTLFSKVSVWHSRTEPTKSSHSISFVVHEGSISTAPCIVNFFSGFDLFRRLESSDFCRYCD